MKHSGSNGRERPKAGEKGATRGMKRRRPIRAHVKEGIESALRTEPVFLATTRTRTALGQVIREMVLEAGRGKIQAIRLMLSLIAYEEPEEDGTPGICDETVWDWTEEGVWEGNPETPEEIAEGKRQTAEAIAMLTGKPPAGEKGWARNELRRRLYRIVEAHEEEEARQAKLAAEATASGDSANAAAPPHAPPPPDPHAGSVRMGTPLV